MKTNRRAYEQGTDHTSRIKAAIRRMDARAYKTRMLYSVLAARGIETGLCLQCGVITRVGRDCACCGRPMKGETA